MLLYISHTEVDRLLVCYHIWLATSTASLLHAFGNEYCIKAPSAGLFHLLYTTFAHVLKVCHLLYLLALHAL